MAIAVPQHNNSSAPSEFETMLEAPFLALEGVVRPLQYLRSRILARHTHATLKGGVTLVTVYLEPGMRASGLNLRQWDLLAACVLCFDGPGSPRCTGTWSRTICPRPVGLTPSTARFSLLWPRVQEELVQSLTASSSPRRWLIWCNRLRL